MSHYGTFDNESACFSTAAARHHYSTCRDYSAASVSHGCRLCTMFCFKCCAFSVTTTDMWNSDIVAHWLWSRDWCKKVRWFFPLR
ncbi:hypothetical protein IG631_22722 [Alternaria alternata]|nr:hypothetical protein IG631_22722 [Alternaria alternata]